MRYSTKPTVRAAILAVSTAAISLISACTPQKTAELTQSEQVLILDEIGLDSTLVGYDDSFFPVTGPSLIAGDWLAVQCAQAGGYFDSYDWAPVYATVETADFE